MHTRNMHKGTIGEQEIRGRDDVKVSWFEGGGLKLRSRMQGREREKEEEVCVGSEAPKGAEPVKTNSHNVLSSSPNQLSSPMCLLAVITPHAIHWTDERNVAVICHMKTAFTSSVSTTNTKSDALNIEFFPAAEIHNISKMWQLMEKLQIKCLKNRQRRAWLLYYID